MNQWISGGGINGGALMVEMIMNEAHVNHHSIPSALQKHCMCEQ